MSRARTLAGAIGSDGALNVADVAGLAAVASSGSASDLSTGTLPIARVADGAVTPAKLSTGAPSWASNGTMTLGSLASVGVEATPNSSGMRVNNWGNAGLPNAASETYVYDNQATTTSKEVTYDVSRLSGDLNTGMRELYTKSGSTWYNTLRLRNGVVELPQGQLKFPVSQNASSDANTLDDYEEGTFTPTINLLGTLTYGNRFGKYQKIGKFVYVAFSFSVSSTDSAQDGSPMQITGLPFTSSSDGSNYANGAFHLATEAMRGTQAPTAQNTFFGLVDSAATTASVVQNNYNATISGKSWYGGNRRDGYTGGTMYMLAQFRYETNQ